MDKRCPYLLISLLSVLSVYPYLLGRPSTEILLVFLNATVVVTAIYAVRHTPRNMYPARAIGIPQLILSFVNVATPGYDVSIPQAITTKGGRKRSYGFGGAREWVLVFFK